MLTFCLILLKNLCSAEPFIGDGGMLWSNFALVTSTNTPHILNSRCECSCYICWICNETRWHIDKILPNDLFDHISNLLQLRVLRISRGALNLRCLQPHQLLKRNSDIIIIIILFKERKFKFILTLPKADLVFQQEVRSRWFDLIHYKVFLEQITALLVICFDASNEI